MSYPGNQSLAADIQQRILNTYQQTLDLIGKGNLQEARLGCDFILRLDPSFEPGRQLRKRLTEGGESIDLSGLGLPAAEDPGDATHPNAASRPHAEPASTLAPRPSEDALEAALGELLEKRDLRRLVQVAEDRKMEVAGNPALRKIVETAYTLLEAEPYVLSFLANARQALDAGDLRETESQLEKARSLDPSHPAIAEVARVRNARLGISSPASGASPDLASDSAPKSEFMDADALFADDSGDLFGSAPQDDLFDLPREPFEASVLEHDPRGKGDDDLYTIDPQLAPPREMLFSPSGSEVHASTAAASDIPAVDPGLVQPGEDIFAASPAAAPPQAGPSSLDASEGIGSSMDSRVQELLDEGQGAFARRDYQGAIDIWSRIFLINIDHPEATRRIEEARRRKEETERHAEELYHEASDAWSRGDLTEAEEKAHEALAVLPTLATAQELLNRIQRGDEPTTTVASRSTPPPAPAWEPTPAASPFQPAGAPTPASSRQEILVPPDPVPAQAPSSRPTARAGAGGRNFLVIGGAVLLLVLVAGFFAWQQWDKLFPNAEAPQTAQSDPIQRAIEVHDGGELERAINMLARLPNDHPRQIEAHELLARWEAELAAVEEADAALGDDGEGDLSSGGLTVDQLTLRDEIIDAARQHHADAEFLLTDLYLRRAHEIAPLTGSTAELHADAKRRLEPLSQEIELFQQREWEFVLPRLWALREENPGDKDVLRLIVDCYYNLGVRDLQRGDAAQAVRKFEEALALRPRSKDLVRQHLFAETYKERQKDLLYRIYVKYLPYR